MGHGTCYHLHSLGPAGDEFTPTDAWLETGETLFWCFYMFLWLVQCTNTRRILTSSGFKDSNKKVTEGLVNGLKIWRYLKMPCFSCIATRFLMCIETETDDITAPLTTPKSSNIHLLGCLQAVIEACGRASQSQVVLDLLKNGGELLWPSNLKVGWRRSAEYPEK